MKVPATLPFFSENDINYILENFRKILEGDSFLSMSVHGESFEQLFSSYIGTKYGVACNSGTSALELICLSIDVDGKEVILPSNTFLATAIAIIRAGGTPVFADCDNNMCLSSESVTKNITKKTAAVIIVHIGGIVSESTIKIQEICRQNDILLIEDAAQAHGSSLNDTKAGAFGIAAGFSFFSTKVMTTGEGGMVTTDDFSLVQKMRSDREFGKVKKGNYVNYHESFGYNWRMPEIAALLGIRQLQALSSFINRRQEIAKIYDTEFEGFQDITIVNPVQKDKHNYFKYIILLPNHDRAKVHIALQENGISPSGYVYEFPLHKLPVFPQYNDITFLNTEYMCTNHLCLPIFYMMSNEQAYYVASSLKKILGQRSPVK